MKKLITIILLFLSIISFGTNYNISSGGIYHQYSDVSSLLSSGDSVFFNREEVFEPFSVITSGVYVGAYGTGADPIITGFTTVTAWTDLGSNIWESTNAVSTLSTCEMVSINGVNTAKGRTPNFNNSNADWYFFQSHSGTTSITSSNLSGTPNWAGAEAVVRTSLYTLHRLKIASQSGGTLTWATGPDFAPAFDNGGFFIQDDPRTLDVQNEWYYNPTTHKIRIFSTSQPTNVKVASIQNIITFEVSNCTIENLDVIGANSTGMYSDAINSNRHIKNCNVSFCGLEGIHIVGSHYSVESCTIDECNDIALNTSSNSTYGLISGNTITNTGTLVGMGVRGGYTGISSGGDYNHNVVIQNCNIENIGFNGVSLGGDSIVIKNCYVTNFCNFLNDGGGIYVARAANPNANQILDNVVVDACKSSYPNYGTPWQYPTYPHESHGIYCDVVTTNYVVKGNTVSNVTRGILTAACTNVDIEYNTIYNTGKDALTVNEGTYTGTPSITIMHNIVVQNNTQPLAWYVVSNTTDQTGVVATYDYNIYARPLDDFSYETRGTYTQAFYCGYGTGTNARTFEQWKSFSGQESHSTKSPFQVAGISDVVFKYNATSSSVVESLDFPCVDMTNTTKYASSVTVPAYSSVILLKDPNPDVDATTTLTLTTEVSYPIYTTSYFTISPNGNYTGSVTITPSGTGATGLLPITKTWSGTAESKVFTITPLAVGSITLTTTNSNGLTNPNPVTFTVTAQAIRKSASHGKKAVVYKGKIVIP